MCFCCSPPLNARPLIDRRRARPSNAVPFNCARVYPLVAARRMGRGLPHGPPISKGSICGDRSSSRRRPSAKGGGGVLGRRRPACLCTGRGRRASFPFPFLSCALFLPPIDTSFRVDSRGKPPRGSPLEPARRFEGGPTPARRAAVSPQRTTHDCSMRIRWSEGESGPRRAAGRRPFPTHRAT